MTPPIASMRSEIRALPRGVWILFAETLVNRLGTFVLVFLVLWLTRIGWSAGMAGFAVSVYGLGGLVASLAGGWLADRLGRRRTIAASAANTQTNERSATIPPIAGPMPWPRLIASR